MKRKFPTPSRIALAAAAAVCSLAAHGQTETAAPPAEAASAPQDAMKLDSVVITGSSTRTTKMRQSLSVSTLDADQITRIGATNAAEILRSVPGIRSESSGGEGNANIGVRGVPISAGGSRYVQLQEDGLPLLLFGDIAFGTPDEFLRADSNIDRLEVVRGGSGSTLASNAPGGIINFLSKTGDDPGGSIRFGVGLDRRENRLDFDDGGKLGERTSFHVGGFARVGEGGRPIGYNAASGGQLKGNITQQFDTGYVRVSLKALDDKTPSLQTVPVTVSNGHIQTIPGIDPRTAYFITNSLRSDVGIDRNGNPATSDAHDGLHVKSNALGVESEFALGNDWTVTEKFRRALNSGRFIALYPNDNGSNATQSYFAGVLFNTSLDDMNNTFNDLKLSKVWKFGSAKTTLTGGLFYGLQNVAQTWFFNTYDIQLKGTDAQVVDANGNPTSTPVATGYTTFGGCCTRTYQVQYTQKSPYVALSWDSGPWNVDASVRRDNQSADGYTLSSYASNATLPAGSAPTPGFDPSTRKTVDYSISHTSYSVGASFAVSRDLNLFARVSDGVSFMADRILYDQPLDGSSPIQYNELRQYEGGVKWRRGQFSAFATFFKAKTDEASSFGVTTQTFTANRYSAQGVELETAYAIGNFRINAGATYTDATIESSSDPLAVGKRPKRQAKWVYQAAPTYSLGDAFDFGASFVGTTQAYGDDTNTIVMPGYVITNAFATYHFNQRIQIGLSVNNLFNRLAYTEVQTDGPNLAHGARAFDGRTTRLSLAYQF